MAASTVRTNFLHIREGSSGRKAEYGSITYDSDATVEVPTTLSKVENFGYAQLGTATETLSLNESDTAGVVTTPSTGTLTVAASGNNSETFHYWLLGF